MHLFAQEEKVHQGMKRMKYITSGGWELKEE
jgi:hypothetical protein